jgi:hypothetical protein
LEIGLKRGGSVKKSRVEAVEEFPRLWENIRSDRKTAKKWQISIKGLNSPQSR